MLILEKITNFRFPIRINLIYRELVKPNDEAKTFS